MRDAHTATLLPNGRVLVAGGEEVNEGGFAVLLASAELYDPASGLFSLTGSMVTGRELHTATLMGNGKSLVAGGEDAKALTPSLSPKSVIWLLADIPTGSMGVGRYGHTGTALPSGEVLIAGGERIDEDGFDIALSSAEIYNPSTGRFHPTGSNGQSRVSIIRRQRSCATARCCSRAARTTTATRSKARDLQPGSGTFRTTGRMMSAHDSGTANLLGDGRVLIAAASAARAASPPRRNSLIRGAPVSWTRARWDRARVLHRHADERRARADRRGFRLQRLQRLRRGRPLRNL